MRIVGVFRLIMSIVHLFRPVLVVNDFKHFFTELFYFLFSSWKTLRAWSWISFCISHDGTCCYILYRWLSIGCNILSILIIMKALFATSCCFFQPWKFKTWPPLHALKKKAWSHPGPSIPRFLINEVTRSIYCEIIHHI